MRGGRDWYPRGSPQGMAFSSYRNPEEDFYPKDQGYKTEKLPRAPYQRHEAKPRRRDGPGDYHGRTRHSESDMTEEMYSRTPEDKRQSSPGKGRSKKTSRRHGPKEKQESQPAPGNPAGNNTGNTAGNTAGNNAGNNAGNTGHQSKDRPSSPQQSRAEANKTEVTACVKENQVVEVREESGEDTEGECWYPGNMEELVTVDEVGGEDDSIVEPDLPELLEGRSCSAAEQDRGQEPPAAAATATATATPRDAPEREKSTEPAKPAAEEPPKEELMEVRPQTGAVSEAASEAAEWAIMEAPAQPIHTLNDFPGQELKEALEEACTEVRAEGSVGPSEEEQAASASEDSMIQDVAPAPETNTKETQHKEETPKMGVHNITSNMYQTQVEIEGHSPTREQDRVISEHSIPLGVEFIVPRAGFFCKLCGLFYTSEETAKTAHCRSTVHYGNLQKYLTELAEESLLGAMTRQPSSE